MQGPETGDCESIHAKVSVEFHNGEIVDILREARIFVEEWKKHRNTKRPQRTTQAGRAKLCLLV